MAATELPTWFKCGQCIAADEPLCAFFAVLYFIYLVLDSALLDTECLTFLSKTFHV